MVLILSRCERYLFLSPQTINGKLVSESRGQHPRGPANPCCARWGSASRLGLFPMQGWALSRPHAWSEALLGVCPMGLRPSVLLASLPRLRLWSSCCLCSPSATQHVALLPQGAPVSGSPLSRGREESIFELSTLSGRDCLEESKGAREGGDQPVAVMGAVQVQPQRRCSSSSFIPSGTRSPSLAQDCGETGRVKGRGKRGRKGVFQVCLLCPPSQILRSVWSCPSEGS